MKKLITLLFIFTLFFVGCEDKEKGEVLTLGTGQYYDKMNLHNGEPLEWINLKDSSNVEKTTCGADAGCSLFKGTYEVEGALLKITLKEYSEVDEWVKLDKEEVTTYTITANNEFTKDESIYVLKKEANSATYDVKLEQQNESFEFDKLSLEFTGSKAECEGCYHYMLITKYDGKEVGKGFFNDEERFLINSSNMAATFTVYRIEEVYILVSNFGNQCFSHNALIFNTKGETLKMYSSADISINGKKINVQVSSSGNCMEEGQEEISEFEISKDKLIEK